MAFSTDRIAKLLYMTTNISEFEVMKLAEDTNFLAIQMVEDKIYERFMNRMESKAPFLKFVSSMKEVPFVLNILRGMDCDLELIVDIIKLVFKFNDVERYISLAMICDFLLSHNILYKVEEKLLAHNISLDVQLYGRENYVDEVYVTLEKYRKELRGGEDNV
ncbi:MAG: hypothetical protein ACRC92_11320 [Peptostreptococcaceae bacterium]